MYPVYARKLKKKIFLLLLLNLFSLVNLLNTNPPNFQ